MKLSDALVLSLSAVFTIIGAYEVMTVGLGAAYAPLMLALAFFFWFAYRRKFRP